MSKRDTFKKYVLFIEQYIPKATLTVKQELPDTGVILLRSAKKKARDNQDSFENVDVVLYVDYTKPLNISEVLLPYQDKLLAVTARGEEGAGRMVDVIPHVPYLRTPTAESIRWATNKYEMRKRLKLFDAKNTPKFTRVMENSKKERARVVAKVGFPLVIKPASLQESLLVTICFHEEELEKALRNTFTKLRKNYEKLNRTQLPIILAEEYMDGDMYSVDTYINSRGDTYHCPLVRVRTGRNIGHDDFFNYSQTTPTALKQESIEKAQKVAETAVRALGLRSITAHIELMKIDDDWKVIEVGPRIGGFRELLHELSCGINHSLNDIYIRIPKKPVIPKRCQGFATAMKWFAKTEGVIVEMKGIKRIEKLESFHSIIVNKKIGDRATFARNGGRSIFNLFLYNDDRSKLLADMRRVEQLVEIKIAARGTVAKVKTAAK